MSFFPKQGKAISQCIIVHHLIRTLAVMVVCAMENLIYWTLHRPFSSAKCASAVELVWLVILMWDYLLLFSGMFFSSRNFPFGLQNGKGHIQTAVAALIFFLFIITINAVKSSGSLVRSAAGFCTWAATVAHIIMYVYLYGCFLLIRAIHHVTTVFPVEKISTLTFLSRFSPSSTIFPFSSPFAHFPSYMLFLFFPTAVSLPPEAIHVSEGFSLSHWFPANPSLWARHSRPLTPLRWFTQAVIA